MTKSMWCCVMAGSVLAGLAATGLAHWAAAPPALGGAAIEAAWLARVQLEIAQQEYQPSWTSRGLQAPNRAHGMRAWFEPTGIRVQERGGANEHDLVTLRLAAAGRASAMAPVVAGALTSRDDRVEIRRAGLVEWYRNSRAGLEQGFTIETRPSGGDAFVLELAVEHAAARLDGDGVVFAGESGRDLRYSKLEVRDAGGALLPARMELPRADRLRLVVDDATAAYPIVIDPLLTGTADSVLQADQDGSGLFHVAGAGDVNGDGYGDVIISAGFYDSGEQDEGAAWVFHGSASGVPGGGPATAAAMLQTNQAFANLGSVAGAGDVNGDGYDDVIVGAAPYSNGESQEGVALVFHGGPAGIGNGDPSNADALLEADFPDTLFGWSVAGAGDVNGDGYEDVAVGALGADISGPGSNEGMAFVFHGGASGVGNGNPGSADGYFTMFQSGAQLGVSVALGDVNGDGYDDLIAGAHTYDLDPLDEKGVVFTVRGSVSGIGFYDSIACAGPGAPVNCRLGSQDQSLFGLEVAAGDLNGDGKADLIVGAPLHDEGQTDEGAAFVYLGGVSGVATTPSASIYSDQASAELGSGAAAADVDGDGRDELFVGARLYDAGQTDEGVVFRFDDPSGTRRPGHATQTLQRDQAGAHLGEEVANAGRVNGDGLDDLIACAPGYDSGNTDEGGAFVYHGGVAVCSNGVDDDADGFADHPSDPGCAGAADASERGTTVCDDGLDNDGDTYVDYPTDPGCQAPSAGNEKRECQDGLNNDGQAGIDFDGGASLDLNDDGFIDAAFNPATPPLAPPDPQCTAGWKTKEAASSCGLGFELSLVLAGFAALRRGTPRRRYWSSPV